MEEYPDLSSFGYQINSELGRNREGGRITWQGVSLKSQKTVVIKQFCFAVAHSTWSGYQAYAREIEILQSLSHPGIPQYLDSIETKDGFCLIQEYIAAVNLNRICLLNQSQIVQLAWKLLDILVYLQRQNPPVLHRDIKPDNILLDKELNVYLIDFGFASLGSLEVSGSSVFKGTPGFIAPEQIVKPVLASDLYSLGITLVCLFSRKNIAEVRDFIVVDDPYQLSFKSLLPDLDRQLLNWLKQMTNAKVSQRFTDAIAAKEALLSIKTDSLAIVSEERLALAASSKLPLIVGTLGISAVTAIATWGINFADRQIELTFGNIAVAIVAAIAIGVTELGAISLAQWEEQARVQGAILGTVIPTLLVAVSGLIWGVAEAVEIAAAIAITEILILSYFWWQLTPWQTTSLPLKIGCWGGAIALGIGFTWQLI